MMEKEFLHKNQRKIITIPIERIRPNPYQPRKYFDTVALQELSESIKQYGVLQPISVRQIGINGYELVAGERRLRASKLAGLMEISAVLVDMDDESSAVLAIIENLQREDLTFLEEAQGYQNLLSDYKMTQEELAKKVGKTQSTIANKIRLLRLPISVRKLIQEYDLTERHARALLKLPDEDLQVRMTKHIFENDLNVKSTEALIDKTLQQMLEQEESKKEQKIKRSLRDIRLFMNTIDQAVSIMNQSGIKARYSTHEEEDFYEVKIKIPYK